MDYALMFNVLEGGVSQPISWGKHNLQSDRNIIILDEGSASLFLWHGAKQGLVARRTALRQAESLKGHGYSVGKSIVGRDIKEIKEIDERKMGRDVETDNLNKQLQEILNREFKELDNFIVTFDLSSIGTPTTKPMEFSAVKKQPLTPAKSEVSKVEPPMPIKVEPVTHGDTSKLQKKELIPASEYDMKQEMPEKKVSEVKIPQQMVKETTEIKRVPMRVPLDLAMQAKIGFVFIGILDYFDDIWISKKQDGSYSVEHMDGKVCEFSVEDGKIKFSLNSFTGISTNIKIEIQKKFVELSKLI